MAYRTEPAAVEFHGETGGLVLAYCPRAARGDTIVFVTSRYPSESASDRTSRLQRPFAFPSPPVVLFTAQQPKTDAIRSVHPKLSYGDSDGDIADTHEADPAIRAIRIMRSPVSYNERPVLPGKYGEEILANSAD